MTLDAPKINIQYFSKAKSELSMKRTRSGHGPPCPNFFSPCSLDWQHNSCLPTCFIPDIDDVCSPPLAALLLPRPPVSVRPSVSHLVWPFAVMSALLTVFVLREEGISRSLHLYNELALPECDITHYSRKTLSPGTFSLSHSDHMG